MNRILRQVFNRRQLLNVLLLFCFYIVVKHWIVCDQKPKEENSATIQLLQPNIQKSVPTPQKIIQKSAVTPRAIIPKSVSTPKAKIQESVLPSNAIIQKSVPTTRAIIQKRVPTPKAIIQKHVPTPKAIIQKSVLPSNAIIQKSAVTPRAIIQKLVPTPKAIIQKPVPTPKAIIQKHVPTPKAIIQKPVPTPKAIIQKSVLQSNAIIQKSVPTPKAIIPRSVSVPKAIKQKSAFTLQINVANGTRERENQETKRVAETLTEILGEKLSMPLAHEVKLLSDPCLKKEILANSCNNTCLRMKIPTDKGERVAQIANNRELQLTPKQHEILQEMAKKVPGKYDLVIATGSSSNHFNESQAFLKMLHENVYPHFKNFTLIYYNLGLTNNEKMRLVKYCKCHVVDFPFDKFPSFFRRLACYTWKPVIIKAHIDQSKVFMWMDSSVRFDKFPDKLYLAIKRTQERGLQLPGPTSISASIRTMPSMFHFFGDEPCAYYGMGEIAAGSGFYANEYFVKRLILEPWVACALNQKCMCPNPHPNHSAGVSDKMYREFQAGTGPLVYGQVHRFDQSALSILVQKAYHDRYRDVLFRRAEYLSIVRGDVEDYLPAS